MKVLMIGPFPPVLNGVTVSNEYLKQRLEEKGWTVTKINTETGKIASLQGDKISLFKIITFLSIYKYLFQVMGKRVVYITPGQTFWGIVKYLPFIFVCKFLAISYVLHIHGGYISKAYFEMRPYKQFIFRYCIKGSRSIVALSESLAKNIRDTFGNVTVHIVENFYDPKLIHISVEREKNEVPRFIFLSNLMLGKGILDFLDALIILKNKQHVTFQIAIAGTIEKGIGEALALRINQLKENIYFYGVADLNKKKELLWHSDIFVLPTWYIMEGQPISIIEAYVTGNIVVSTLQGGIIDISQYETFIEAPKQDPRALSVVLEQTLNQIPLLKQKSIETMKLTQKRFDATVFADKMHAILLNAK
jgi:glycosyltransferase involved in cell wall biosynthesis